MKITINNWDKYNPKRDQKSYTWLRLDNDIPMSQDLFGLTPGQKYTWIVLLCYASKKNSGEIDIELSYLSHLSGEKEKEILKMFNHLSDKGVLTIPDTTLHYTKLHQTTPTNETYVRDVRDVRDEHTHVISSANADLCVLRDVWNQNCQSLPKVQKLTARRRQAANARWKEKPDRKYWDSLVQSVTKTAFLMGDSSRGWRANFDWFIRPDTHIKISEGHYGAASFEIPKTSQCGLLSEAAP